MNARKLIEIALLTAIALVIFLVELRLPTLIPVPGIKLGLANIITVYAIYKYQAREVVLLVLVRIFLGAIFSGNLMVLLYSLAGGILCLAGMLALRKMIPEKCIWVSSVLGAVLHNIGQISVAVLVTGTITVIAYLPFLIVSGCIAGGCTGLCAQYVIKRKPILM
ncbi:Gx transporter family protein [Acetonema longum]|nr:Gx transporter family protein [Acetonema longum]